jgi:hypothetical protein
VPQALWQSWQRWGPRRRLRKLWWQVMQATVQGKRMNGL